MSVTRSTRILAVAAAAVSVACGSDSNGAAPPDLISVHWAAEQPDANVRMCVVAATGEQIGLDPKPIIGVGHFERAYLARPSDKFVTVQLTEQGRTTLAAATAQRIGDRLAIVVEDRVVALPVIMNSLDLPSLPLMPQVSTAEAEALAARINEAIARNR